MFPSTVERWKGPLAEIKMEDLGKIYLAPETTRADPAQGPSLDVFSLGCIAYQLFSGQPPAESVLDLAEKLRAGQGLRLSDVLDGCGARQQELIQFATCPDVRQVRSHSVSDSTARRNSSVTRTELLEFWPETVR